MNDVSSDTPAVLIVDDEPANRALLVDLVTREGYTALVAADGAEALATLARQRVDLVFLDLTGSVMGGMAVLAELQRLQLVPALPVVIVAAQDDRSQRIDALSAGAIDFLSKPLDRYEVTCKVRTFIELKRLRERAVAAVQGQLRESDHLLSLRFEQSPVAQMSWDTNFRATAWNPAAEKLFGYTRAEALGQPSSFVVPAAAQAHVEAVGRELLGGRANETTNENVRKDGRTLTCLWHNAPLSSADGSVVGVSSVVLDVTERTRLQNALVQSQKMDAMGQLAGGVAHDFNNILAIILSYATFLRDALPEGDERREDILEVLKASDRAAALTQQLLAFSRQQPKVERPTDLNQSLVQLRKILARTLGGNIDLCVVPSARPSVVRLDPVQFDQIVLNLALNARDAMPKGGQLRIALEHPMAPRSAAGDRGWVQLKISDTGVGMDPETVKQIFDPFFTTKANGQGTGLGLAMCCSIVAEVGGKIMVDSTQGHGTTFTVELPLCGEHADVPGSSLDRVPRLGRGEIVLVVEDDAALQRVTARVLGSAGYTVHVASDGHEAMHKLGELGTRLNVLVSDVVIPGPNGYEVAAHAARVAPGAARILTSGLLHESGLSPEREGWMVLRKPVPPYELVRAVDEVLRAAAPADAVATGSVLLVQDEQTPRGELAGALARAGYTLVVTSSVADTRRALSGGLDPQLVLCDVPLRDGSGTELLDWIQATRPTLCPKVRVLIDEIGAAGARGLKRGIFRVLARPLDPATVLVVLAKRASATGSVPCVSVARISPPSVARAPNQAASTGVALRRESVLIVEDDELLGQAARRTLCDDFEVQVVGTLVAARAALEEGELDALVLDVSLPDGSGLDLLQELRGKNSELAVVLMTGMLSTETATRAFRSRVTAYLPKPCPPEELLRAVRAAADAGRVARVRTKLLAARFGGDEFVNDLRGTERVFTLALPKIRMAFQPIVRSADSSVYGYEALLRCDEPSLSSPLRLLAAAEVLGRVDDVGRAVRRGVAAAMRAERDRLEAIFVNLHPSEVRADLLAEVTDPLLALAERVVLEITERATLAAGPKLDEELSRIRGLGYRLAVDDLGEGYAGLSSLVHLRPDIAKIDMSLVRDVHRLPLKRDIVAALVDMARRSGIVVVAEGVETVDERDTLVDLGCDLLQGYLFAKPGPAFPVPRTTFERKEERR